MLEKTRGIVLHSIKFKETSLIVKIYTERFGIQSYIINGVRSRKPKMGAALFQPLTVLDLVVYHKESQTLKRISEVKCIFPFYALPGDFRKISIGIFISEILFKCLKEEHSDESLFSFLLDVLEKLGTTGVNPDFHLIFLFRFSHYLGFGPSEAADIKVSVRVNDVFPQLENAELSDSLMLSNSKRRELLEDILQFYMLHVEGFNDLKSLKILKEITS